MKKLVHPIAAGMFLLLALLSVPAAVRAQALPPPRSFVSNLDVRCYKIPNQPPLGINLRLDHLNPVFQGFPPEFVAVREPQDLCVPVYKESQVPPPDVLPFIRFVDWKCYGISGPSLDLPLHLDHLNPVIVGLFGPSETVTVREPQQLCVPVSKNQQVVPPEVLNLVSFLDVKCYRIDSDRIIGGEQIKLTHLNPLFTSIPSETATFVGPAPVQLCVPVTKNQQQPPSSVFDHIRFSDVLCYNIKGLPLNMNLKLTHLNPVLINMGLPPEKVLVTETDKLCVPVAKNGLFPPG